MTKKEKLIAVALKLFNRKGYKATTMRDIAAEMGFEVANIYNYIKSKQEILETCIFDVMKEFNDSLANIVASSYSPRQKLHHIVAMHIQMIAKKPYEMALINNEWRNLEIEKLKQLLATRKAYDLKVEEVIRDGIEKGEFRSLDVETTTLIVLSTVRWLYDKYTNENLQMNPIEIERQITEFIFEGIGAQQST